MILLFPDHDALLTILAGGIVPPEVSVQKVFAGVDEKGRPWIDTSAKLSRAVTSQLAKLGVTQLKVYPTLGADLTNWLQAIPLARDERLPDAGSATPVIFELPDSRLLPEFVGEMLRLGVDRQSFRWLSPEGGTPGTVLLRVAGPPYYTLLRALDRDQAGPRVRAYIERAANVWVELGWNHPLAESIAPVEGQCVMLRPPRDWAYLADAPFRDIYEIIDFKLPQSHVDWQSTELKQRLKVPLKLVDADRQDAELWVLRDRPVEQIDAFVRDAREGLIQRLIFAVGQSDDRLTIVLRVRPSKQPPPQLSLDVEAHARYLKLDNLFVPIGSKVHPVLRRDALRKLLADDPDRITWLRPVADPPGAFIPESLPDDAFRPLHEWVDYVLDHDRAALAEWMRDFKFDFDPFVCTEDAAEPRPKAPPGGRRRAEEDDAQRPGTRSAANPAKASDAEFKPPREEFARIEVLPPSQLQKDLAALEKQFLDLDTPLDDPERLPLWSEMAVRNAALKNTADAALCWLGLLWELLDLRLLDNELRKEADPKARERLKQRLDRLRELLHQYGGEEELAWHWLRSESYFRDHSERAFDDLLADRKLKSAHLDTVLKIGSAAPHEVRAVMALATWATRHPDASAVLRPRLAELRQFIERHERTAAVRALWLAALSLARFSGDALGLARVRDRQMARLIAGGLSPEYDVPNLLRNAGHQDSERMRRVRTHVGEVHKLARQWCDECMAGDKTVGQTTGHLVDLLFAFAYARLNEPTPARELLKNAQSYIQNRSVQAVDTKLGNLVVNQFLCKAFTYRIEEALAGRPHRGPLPESLRLELELQLPPTKFNQDRLAVERLREQSFILEPEEKTDPYRDFHENNASQLERQISTLWRINDGNVLALRIQDLLRSTPDQKRHPDDILEILADALVLAPRGGESLVNDLLQRIDSAVDAASQCTTRKSTSATSGDSSQAINHNRQKEKLAKEGQIAIVLDRAVTLAVNYDHVEFVKTLGSRFVQLLRDSANTEITSRSVMGSFGNCLRTLRKLGQRNEMLRLLEHGESLVRQNRTISALRDDKCWPSILGALLQLAGGWLSFGRSQRATEVFEAARSYLFDNLPTPTEYGRINDLLLPYTVLAPTYANAVGFTPIDEAISRITEMFHRLWRFEDRQSTNRYYAWRHFNIIEAVVRAIVHEDFAMGPGARKWMDDDEFLVRRRINRDHRAMA